MLIKQPKIRVKQNSHYARVALAQKNDQKNLHNAVHLGIYT